MSGVRVFPEISAFASGKMAVYVGASSLSNLALTSFRTALATTVGNTIALGVRPFVVRCDSATTPAGNAGDIATAFEVNGRDISLKAVGPINVAFSLGVVDAAQTLKVLTTLSLEIRDLAFTIDVAADKLMVSAGNAQWQPQAPLREPDFDATVAAYGLDPVTTTRVEGMLLYSGIVSAITKTLSTPQQVDLSRLFPSIAFQGSIQYGVSSDDRYLFLTATAGVVFNKHGCDCVEFLGGIGPVEGGKGQLAAGAPRVPGNGDAVGTVTIGGPTPIADPTPLLGRRANGQGDSGVYMPNSVAESIAQGPYPAVRIDLSDNGFIGWKAVGVVDFNGIAFTPDPARGRFYVDITFRVEVYGSVNVDLGKLGKVRVTEFSAEQAGPGANSVRIGFYIVLGRDGLYLKPVLEDVSFGDFEVFLRLGTLVGTPFGGWGAVIGFIFDVVLSKIIGSQIPLHLDLELRKYMAKEMFPLVEANYAAELEELKPMRLLSAFHDGGAGGFLFSAGIDG